MTKQSNVGYDITGLAKPVQIIFSFTCEWKLNAFATKEERENSLLEIQQKKKERIPGLKSVECKNIN